MRRASLASKVIDVLNLANEQRALLAEMRILARKAVAIGKKAQGIVDKLDEDNASPTMLDEALYENDAQPFDEDQIAELTFNRESLALFDVPKTTLAVLKIAEKES